MLIDLERCLRARPSAKFFGRGAELARMNRLVARGLQGRAAPVGLRGEAGIGKSELLRQALLGLVERGAEVIPVYLDLSSLDLSGSDHPERDAWTRLLGDLLRALVAHDQSLPLLAPPLLGASPAQLAQRAYRSGLGEWSPLLLEGLPRDRPEGEEFWRGILRSASARFSARPLVALDGAARGEDPQLFARIAASIARASAAEGIPFLAELDPPLAAHWRYAEGWEAIDLAGLAPAAAEELVQDCAEDLGAAPPVGAVAEVLGRLAGNPEVLRAWTLAWSRLPGRLTAMRRAEEAYLSAIDEGAPALAWRAALDRAAPLALRSGVLQLLSDLAAEPAAFMPADEAAARLGLEPERAELLLAGLVREGFLLREGEGYAPPLRPALRDWTQIQARRTELGGGADRVRAEMLRRLLGARVEAHAPGQAAPEVKKLLAAFNLQSVPQALLRCEYYFEALGEVPEGRRAAEVMRSSRSTRLPEVIGVIPASPARRAAPGAEKPAHAPLYYAYAFREGVYQRSHEETWIAGDFTASPTLTSLEVDLFLDRARELERRLGPGRYVKCLFAGETVSPEAIERLREARLYCLSAEQARILEDCLAPHEEAEAARPAGRETEAAVPLPPRAPVIPIRAAEPAATSRLSLAARGENELIAALMAEKIALRSGLSAEASGQVKMAVLEGCLNAIEHSANTEKQIAIKFSERPGELEIAIENEGRHFDPAAVAEPDPKAKIKSPHKRGWGIKLMRQFMDEVIFERTTAGTRLRLIKRIPRAAGESGARAEAGGDAGN